MTDEAVTWQPPIGPPPRQRYLARTSHLPRERGWSYTQVDVLRCGTDGEPETQVAEYVRNYGTFFSTFEPFRQDDRDYALISRHYAMTSVLDLQTGNIIAEEAIVGEGFCPVQFYVPDWRELHDEAPYTTDFPAAKLAQAPELAGPRGDFGFVAGCRWGGRVSLEAAVP